MKRKKMSIAEDYRRWEKSVEPRRYGRLLAVGLIIGALVLVNLVQYVRASELESANHDLESSNENLRITNHELENEVDNLKERLAWYENIFENIEIIP